MFFCRCLRFLWIFYLGGDLFEVVWFGLWLFIEVLMLMFGFFVLLFLGFDGMLVFIMWFLLFVIFCFILMVRFFFNGWGDLVIFYIW